MGLGLIARINRRANAYPLPLGSAGYQVALLRELVAGRMHEWTVTVDGDTREVTGLLVAIMNLPTLGGGIRLAPQALPDDGLLDVVVVSDATRRRVFSVLPLLATAKHERLPEVTIERVREVTIDGPDLLTYADGDPVGNSRLTVRVEPGALRVWAPIPE